MEDFGNTYPNRQLTQLIGSRICHDLISPVGAISNGLELLRLSGAPEGPEMELMQASADNANGRIRFFRVAFGLSCEDQVMDAEGVRALAAAFFDARIALDWRLTGDMPRPVAQALCLGLLCAERALLQGGTLAVAGTAGEVRITASGPRIAQQGGVWDMLDGGGADAAPLTAADVQFALLPETLARLGRRAVAEWSGESLLLRF
ncbi:histidine phosphotransferase [Roseovarius spongiae]|uniref:Histidine phosphotransferase n=1 Tax=Roseovarius spongiae TaxID=2320272 RepID=A0A3A8BBW1_9RHOB|nr:histidine phosphotransferase family protein [Roseovarius spongiae]RKF17024.1 histidine phosphotransferase [Roseovarius spongiae]